MIARHRWSSGVTFCHSGSKSSRSWNSRVCPAANQRTGNRLLKKMRPPKHVLSFKVLSNAIASSLLASLACFKSGAVFLDNRLFDRYFMRCAIKFFAAFVSRPCCLFAPRQSLRTCQSDIWQSVNLRIGRWESEKFCYSENPSDSANVGIVENLSIWKS